MFQGKFFYKVDMNNSVVIASGGGEGGRRGYRGNKR